MNKKQMKSLLTNTIEIEQNYSKCRKINEKKAEN